MSFVNVQESRVICKITFAILQWKAKQYSCIGFPEVKNIIRKQVNEERHLKGWISPDTSSQSLESAASWGDWDLCLLLWWQSNGEVDHSCLDLEDLLSSLPDLSFLSPLVSLSKPLFYKVLVWKKNFRRQNNMKLIY